LLAQLRPGHAWEGDRLDRVHRDTGGNPRRLITALPVPLPLPRPLPARPTATRPRPLPTADQPGRPDAPVSMSEPAWNRPTVGANKPPLRLEEGLIEVGWEPAPASDLETPRTATETRSTASAPGSLPSEEA